MKCDNERYDHCMEEENATRSKMYKETPVPVLPKDWQLATAYVAYQIYGPLYKLKEGFHKGTLFPELYRPYPGTYEFSADIPDPSKK